MLERTLAPAIEAAADRTASTIAGCPYPRLAAPHDADRSSILRPSSPIRYEPDPAVTASGKNRSFSIPAIAEASRSASPTVDPSTERVDAFRVPDGDQPHNPLGVSL